MSDAATKSDETRGPEHAGRDRGPSAKGVAPSVLVALASLLPALPPVSADDHAAFARHRADQDFRNWRLFSLFAGLTTLLLWPTDLVLYRGLPYEDELIARFALGRGLTIATTLGIVLLTALVPSVRRHGLFVMGLGGAFIFLFCGIQFGQLAGPEAPWLHFGYLSVLPVIAIHLPPLRRFFTTLGSGAVFMLGYFGWNLEHLGSPLLGTTLNFFAFAVALSWFAGVATDRLRLGAFVLLRRSERQAAELGVLKTELERRVDERTGEVRRLLQHVETARESERAHLARELHDQLGQELTALHYAIELAQRRHALDPSATSRHLAEMDLLLQRARKAMRETVFELRPQVLEDLGLAAAAKLLAQRTAERSGVAVAFSAEPDVAAEGRQVGDEGRSAAADEVATAGYRILQECLTNALRHGAARRIDVALVRDGAALVLRVQDDGVGFDPATVQGGFGLLGMRERAAALGIALTIASAPGQGTRVEARLPLGGGA